MQPHAQSNDISALVRQMKSGSRAALSRVLSLATADHLHSTLATSLGDLEQDAPPVIGLTGSGGVGKSSLLGALATHFAGRGERVGVLACDPESPITGGALLGDRCRIVSPATSERIFVRSLSTASGQQGLAPHIELMLRAMRAFGFDRLFVETVGAGQGDVAVRVVADVVVLVLQPQTGDELQWEKAGILEIADIVVVNKCDLPGSDRTVAEVTHQLRATGAPRAPVENRYIAKSVGFHYLCRAIDSVAASLDNVARDAVRRIV
jgi:LAO/AO transport system ATPase